MKSMKRTTNSDCNLRSVFKRTDLIGFPKTDKSEYMTKVAFISLNRSVKLKPGFNAALGTLAVPHEIRAYSSDDF